VWEEAQSGARYKIRFAISKEPILADPEESQPYTPETYASGVSQPRREHVSKCLGEVRSHCRAGMQQGELLLGFPRRYTALLYTKKLNSVSNHEHNISGLYNYTEG
jgi:hypothetical protein